MKISSINDDQDKLAFLDSFLQNKFEFKKFAENFMSLTAFMDNVKVCFNRNQKEEIWPCSESDILVCECMLNT